MRLGEQHPGGVSTSLSICLLICLSLTCLIGGATSRGRIDKLVDILVDRPQSDHVPSWGGNIPSAHHMDKLVDTPRRCWPPNQARDYTEAYRRAYRQACR